MEKIQKYGWVVGLVCILLGIFNIYSYVNIENTSVALLGVGIFALISGTFNLTVYYLTARKNKR